MLPDWNNLVLSLKLSELSHAQILFDTGTRLSLFCEPSSCAGASNEDSDSDTMSRIFNVSVSLFNLFFSVLVEAWDIKQKNDPHRLISHTHITKT